MITKTCQLFIFIYFVISCKLHTQRCFNYGQMYVVFSRVTSLNALFLIDDYLRSAIRADRKAAGEYEILRQEYSVEPIEDYDLVSDSTLTITLLNTRSLRKHTIDIVHDNILMDTDVICLTKAESPLGGKCRGGRIFPLLHMRSSILQHQ